MRKVSGGEYTAMRVATRFILTEVARALFEHLPSAWIPEMVELLAASDTWVVYGPDGFAKGVLYFVRHGDAGHLHGGFWDGRLLDKRDVLEAVIRAQPQSHVFVVLDHDRVGNVYAWWLERLGFERTEDGGYMLLSYIKEG